MSVLDEVSPIILLNAKDNVAVARRPVRAGERLEGGVVAAIEVPSGHKIALRAVPLGFCRMYIRASPA